MSKPSAFARKLRDTKQTAEINRHVRALRTLLVRHPAVKAAFQALPRAQRDSAWINVSDYDNSVLVGLTLRELPSFKSRVLQRSIEPFLSSEWTADTQDFTYTGQPNRDFKFKRSVPLNDALREVIDRHPSERWLTRNGYSFHIPRHLDLSVNIYAYVKPDSPTCRVVVTGVTEQVIRTEIKKIVCD